MATESLVAATAKTDYDTGLDAEAAERCPRLLYAAREVHRQRRDRPTKKAWAWIAPRWLYLGCPGGMFSNMLKQLKDAGKEDRNWTIEVLARSPRVREDFAGLSRWSRAPARSVAREAVFNVWHPGREARYKMVTKEFKGLVTAICSARNSRATQPRVHEGRRRRASPITAALPTPWLPRMIDKLERLSEAAKWATRGRRCSDLHSVQVTMKFFREAQCQKA